MRITNYVLMTALFCIAVYIAVTSSPVFGDEKIIETVPETLPFELSENNGETISDETIGEGFLNYEETSFPKQNIFLVLLRLVLSMAAIIAMIYGSVFVLRYFARRGTQKPVNERLIQVIDRVNLDSKRAVYIIKVMDRLMIVGVGTDSVTMLGEIRDETLVESVKANDFSFHLGKIFSRMNTSEA